MAIAGLPQRQGVITTRPNGFAVSAYSCAFDASRSGKALSMTTSRTPFRHGLQKFVNRPMHGTSFEQRSHENTMKGLIVLQGRPEIDVEAAAGISDEDETPLDCQ